MSTPSEHLGNRHMATGLRSVLREMRDYNDSDDGNRPCGNFVDVPGTDACRECRWSEHCHDIERWYLALSSERLDGLIAKWRTKLVPSRFNNCYQLARERCAEELEAVLATRQSAEEIADRLAVVMIDDENFCWNDGGREAVVAALVQSSPPKKEVPRMSTAHCPSCDSPAPHLHPAVQFEGEVNICQHEFHRQVTPQNRVQSSLQQQEQKEDTRVDTKADSNDSPTASTVAPDSLASSIAALEQEMRAKSASGGVWNLMPMTPADMRKAIYREFANRLAEALDAHTAAPMAIHENGPTPAQERCGYCLYGPPALCTCGTCAVEDDE